MDEKINAALLEDKDSGPQLVRKKKKLNDTFFAVILRLTEIFIIYLVPSFIAAYITMYLPKEGSWKMLCFFAFMAAIALHIWCGVDFYRRVEDNLKKYYVISFIMYLPAMAISFLMYAFIDENLLMYNFMFSLTRAFELFYEKTLLSMLICHFCMVVVIGVTPLFLLKGDKEKAELAKLVAESQDTFDEMGMVFDPAELPELPADPDPKSREEKPLGMLFNPDELPDVVEPAVRLTDAVDETYVGGLLFDPEEMPDIPEEVKEQDIEKKPPRLLFDPDEMPDMEDPIMMVSDPIDGGYMGGLLFDPDEMPEKPETEEGEIKDNKNRGLLFNPDESPEENNINVFNDGVDMGYVGGLLFDPDEM